MKEDLSTFNKLLWCRNYLLDSGFTKLDNLWYYSTYHSYPIELKLVREKGFLFIEFNCPRLTQKPLAMTSKNQFKRFAKTIQNLNQFYGIPISDLSQLYN